MPTGYTAIIEDEDATFEEYVWRCARAFGAFVMMRDDPLDAPIPEEFKPSAYYTETLAKDRAELARLTAMTPEETATAAEQDHVRAVEEYQRSAARAATLRDRYAAMRTKVADWTPPTSEHVGLKDFMLQQIDLCAKDGFGPYGKPPKKESGSTWRARRVAAVRSSIEYDVKSLGEEAARAESRTAWVTALRQSVSLPASSTPRGPAATLETKEE